MIAYTVDLSLKVHKERVVQAIWYYVCHLYLEQPLLWLNSILGFIFFVSNWLSPITIPQTNAKEKKLNQG